ncbi:TPA: hypothetical protein ACH7EZ_004345, partial [Escherichia coli]|uniref:hypothetical protein n=1 Tax=Escherichia coli TaxID=562 RepID=UPI00228059EC
AGNFDGIDNVFSKKELTEYNTASSYIRRNVLTKKTISLLPVLTIISIMYFIYIAKYACYTCHN